MPFPGLPIRPFYLMRHGETDANVKNVLSGQEDVSLTAQGRAQARAAQAIVERLAAKPSAVVHSHLSRARETAHCVADGFGLSFSEDSLLGERHFGDWVGIPYDEYTARRAAGINPPGGESAEDFRARIAKGFTRVLAAHERPLIVSHGGVFRGFGELYGVVIGRVKNCALYAFEPHGPQANGFPWRVTSYEISMAGNIEEERLDPTPIE